MTDFNPKADSAKLLWDRLSGKYTLTPGSNQNQLFEGRELSGTQFYQPFRGQSEIIERLPEDQASQLEYIQASNLTIKRKAGGKVKLTESRVFRLSNGKCSIWRADSNGIALENLGTLVRPGSTPEKSQEVIFDVVQEVGNTGKEGDHLAL